MNSFKEIRIDLKTSKRITKTELIKISGVTDHVINRIERGQGVTLESFRAYVQTLLSRCGSRDAYRIKKDVSEYIYGREK